jgi:hypothetical protein
MLQSKMHGSVDRKDVPDRERDGGGGCTVGSVYQTRAFDFFCRSVLENLKFDLSSRVRWRAFLGDKTGFFAVFAAWPW